MKRDKWSVSMRNRLAELAMECDCASAVSSASSWEREELQNKIRSVVDYIDSKIKVIH